MIAMNLDPDLVRLLAATDTLWRPIRNWARPLPVVTVERRSAYRLLGLPVPYFPGGDDAERQRRSREMRQVERSGLIVFGGARGQRSSWRLTDRGDWHARALVGMPGYSDMVIALEAIRQLERVRGEPDDNRVSETWLCGSHDSEPARQRMSCLQLLLAPALCRGLATAWSDCEGRVAYQTVPHVPLPTKPVELPEYDEALADEYDTALATATAGLANAKPANSNLCVIALSAGCWPPIPKSAQKITGELRRLLNRRVKELAA